MFVRSRMTPNPLTASPSTSVLDALETMRQHGIRRLPVLEGDNLVGIVTEMDLLKVSPSAATSLSVFEMNYLLSKMKVRDVMTKNPVTVTPDTTIEEAALLMRENVISGLPVVENGKLVGIVTETNLFDAFIDVMGLRQTGSRLTLEVEDRTGTLAEVATVIKEHGVNIISVATTHPVGVKGVIVVRLATTNPDPIVKDLEAKGIKVVHSTVFGNGA